MIYFWIRNIFVRYELKQEVIFFLNFLWWVCFFLCRERFARRQKGQVQKLDGCLDHKTLKWRGIRAAVFFFCLGFAKGSPLRLHLSSSKRQHSLQKTLGRKQQFSFPTFLSFVHLQFSSCYWLILESTEVFSNMSIWSTLIQIGQKLFFSDFKYYKFFFWRSGFFVLC